MKKLLIAVAVTVVPVFAVPGVASAAPSEKGECRQEVRDFLIGLSEEGTMGDWVSDGLYGNEPNIEPFAPGGPEEQEPGTKGGTVVPSLSPGPALVSGADGPSMGDIQAGIRAVCNA